LKLKNVRGKMQYSDILDKLRALSNPKAVAGMTRFGINPENTYGVSIPNLRSLAKEIGKDHVLAKELWASGIHEARILASMIDDPKMATEAQMERWVKDFDSWDVCDQCCMNLFEKTEYAYQKCVEWSSREAEFVKRAGFVLMARLAVSDKKAGDEEFTEFFPIIQRESIDERNYVKKAVNWALRQIGKRNRSLNRTAIRAAEEIQEITSRSAKWIASDALRELTSEAVQKRLKGRR
jgi:3-methyladenine DNA glycosylase AlkD